MLRVKKHVCVSGCVHACMFSWGFFVRDFLKNDLCCCLSLRHLLCLLVWLAGWLAILHVKNFNVRHYLQAVQPFFFYTCLACRHYWLLPFDATFTDLGLARGSQGQCKAKPVVFIFLHTFHLLLLLGVCSLHDQGRLGDEWHRLLQLLLAAIKCGHQESADRPYIFSCSFVKGASL